MFNNFFFKKTQKKHFLHKYNNNFKYLDKMRFIYKEININMPLYNGIQIVIKSIVRPYNYIFFLKFFNFKKRKFRPRRIIKL